MKKLNDDAVRDIKRRLAAGELQSSIAKLHHMSNTQISLIKHGARYAKIKT